MIHCSPRCRPHRLDAGHMFFRDVFDLFRSSNRVRTAFEMGDIDPYVAESYEITKRLGKGAYGIVWKAIDKRNKKTVALKKIYDAFRNRTDAQRTFREIWYLQEFQNHPNIIRLLEVVKSKNDRDIYLVFDFMDTDLHRAIKNSSLREEWQHRFIIYQLLSALAYIHSANVIHRDLKPSNILVNEKCEVKLADFGLARSLEQSEEMAKDPTLTEYVATRWYRAPEILMGSKKYTKGVDIWSLGCIMGEVIHRKAIFAGTSTLNQIERIMISLPHPTQADIESLCTGYAAYVVERAANKPKRLLNDVLGPECSDDAVDLLSKLLSLNPNRRMTANDGLLHPYVSGYHEKKRHVGLTKAVPPLCEHTKLPVSQYREKLYQMIKDNIKSKPVSPVSRSLSSAYLAKVNEKRIIVKQRSSDEAPTLDTRKEALIKNELSKKQTMAPMSRRTLTPPFLSDRGKFSLGFKHPVVLRGPNTNAIRNTSESKSSPEKKPVPKFGRRQYGNPSNQSYSSSAKAALQTYSQDDSYGTISASSFQAIKNGHW